MDRRTFLQNKLWRDRAVELMEQTGSVIHYKRLDDGEFEEQLRLKMIEEAQEVAQAYEKEDLVAELADVLEVIDSICELRGISREQIQAAQLEKRQKRGGFQNRCFVTLAEHLRGSFGEKYCLADPLKYPEVEPH